MKLPRYVEVIGITGQETSFCKTGVANSKNNCGGIRGGDSFKEYKTHIDSIKDMSRLINTPLYKDKTIDEMNGIYCVDETTSKGGKCPDWSENVKKNINELLTTK